VEAKPVDRAFSGTLSCEGPPVPGGTLTSCKVAGFAYGTRYHWQARTVDSEGLPGDWAPFGLNPETEADFMVSNPPSAPASLGQFQTNGTTAIPPGGITTETAVVFRGTGTDVEGERVRLIVEVKPVDVPFSGSQSCYSAWVKSGTPAQCSVSLAPGRYHWRAQMLDTSTVKGPWASYGGADEAAVDLRLGVTPAAPASLGQFQTNGTTAIPPGGTTAETAVGEKVRHIVEVKRVDTPFSGSQSCFSPWVNSGAPAQCTVTLLPGRYHWRAQMLDTSTAKGPWASYGGNDEAAADLRVVIPPSAPTSLGQFQTNGTTAIPPGGTTADTAVIFKGTGTDAEGERVRLIVEVKPVGVPFSGSQSCYSAWVKSGTPAQCAVGGLDAGSYH
jgi:hypothetical protein